MRANLLAILAALWAGAWLLAPLAAQTRPRKILIAHRGASAYAPEHTAEAYRLAIEQNADFVEQDLAVTKDGVLVSIHDLTLERTTDVEEVFPTRFVDVKDGPAPGRHWFVNDFTLAELKRLDAGSWFDTKFAGSRTLTFQESIDLVRGKAGLCPEVKDPEFYRRRGIDAGRLFTDIVKRNQLEKDPKTPLILQSFDAVTLKEAAAALPDVPRVFLVAAENAALLDSAAKVKEIATWATGLGPDKIIVEQRPALVAWARDAGLTVIPWTFRSSSTRFPSVRDEMRHFLFTLNVDAVFTDNPDQFPRTP